MVSKTKTIKELYNKIENLTKIKSTLRSKLLCDNQIAEEAKRRKEENLSIYGEQVEEINENLKKKHTIIKRLQKKFNEVEIYVQRECQKVPKWKKYFCDFEIVPFLCENETLQYKKKDLYAKIKGLDNEFKIILKENIELKKREEFITEDTDTNPDKGNKYKELIKLLSMKNKFLTNEKSRLVSVIGHITSKIHLNNVKTKLLKCLNENVPPNSNSNENNNNNNMNKSVSYCDIVVDTANSKFKASHQFNTNNNWDISCIEKANDDN